MGAVPGSVGVNDSAGSFVHGGGDVGNEKGAVRGNW